MMAKPGVPANTFPVSMIPWESFDGFNLNLEKGYGYLLPLSIQVNHAVCDGFHVCRFISALREMIDGNVLGL